jgi:hypothetical protein
MLAATPSISITPPQKKKKKIKAHLLESFFPLSLPSAHSEMFWLLDKGPLRAPLSLKALDKARRALDNGLEACLFHKAPT